MFFTEFGVLRQKRIAQIVGRAKMYHQLPNREKVNLPQFPLSDSQVTQVVREYYNDRFFSRNDLGNINFWRLLNLFIGANKSSYIDNFIDRSALSTSFIRGLHNALSQRNNHWFLS